jgi:hypothetical protein
MFLFRKMKGEEEGKGGGGLIIFDSIYTE